MNTRLVVVVFVAAALGCGADPSPRSPDVELPGTPVAISEVRLEKAPPPAPAHVYYSGYAEPARLVIRSQEEWAVAWAKIHQGVSPLPDLPAVDFGADMVVLAAMGTRSSGGFDIAVTHAALDAGTLRMAVVETTPGPRCGVAAVVTQPVAAARVVRHDGAVEFVNASVTARCD